MHIMLGYIYWGLPQWKWHCSVISTNLFERISEYSLANLAEMQRERKKKKTVMFCETIFFLSTWKTRK